MSSQALISLKRQDNSQPWGFRLKGGKDQGIQLYVEHIQPNGRAAHSGLKVGDLVLAICGVETSHLTHSQVKSEMLRAGNEIDIAMQREGSIDLSADDARNSSDGPRAVIDETPLPKLGGSKYKQVTQKTFQVLEGTLPVPEQDQTGEAAAGSRPPSIFDRKKQDRSDYLKAKGNTIQKAFGENAY